jgi:hypothetical protein
MRQTTIRFFAEVLRKLKFRAWPARRRRREAGFDLANYLLTLSLGAKTLKDRSTGAPKRDRVATTLAALEQ